MPTWPFNNVSTVAGYTDATTAQFPIGRPGFAIQVYNGGIYYKLIRFRPPNSFYLDETEHFLGPVNAVFSDPLQDGLQPGELYGGIAVRSNTSPAKVSVV